MRSDDGNCALIVEQLADAGLLLGRQLGDVGGEVGADGHAFLNGWTLGDLLPYEPIDFVGKPVLPVVLQRALKKAEGLICL
jgi:hypothetical protein